jgi:hypothetical protein
MAGMLEQFESPLVNDDVMMEPAKGKQVLRVGGPAFAPRQYVVDFHPVPTATTVYGTVATGDTEYCPAQCWRNHSRRTSVTHRDPVSRVDGYL